MKLEATVPIMHKMLREQYPTCWSHKGAIVMAMWLNDFMEEDAVFDASYVSTTFKEYPSAIAFAEEQFSDYKKHFAIREHDGPSFVYELIIAWLGKRTMVIEFDDGAIIVKEIGKELENKKQ